MTSNSQEHSEKVESESTPEEIEPRRWSTVTLPFVASILVGIAIGGGLFTFDYAAGTSYLSSASDTCANCHIMQNHYDAWAKSTHSQVAECNDCHAPHDFFGKWYCKGRNGLLHSVAFTLQNFHEPIMIHDYNRQVVEDNCRYCHDAYVHSIDSGIGNEPQESLSCIKCHGDVGHPN